MFSSCKYALGFQRLCKEDDTSYILFFLMWHKSDGQFWESSKLHIRRGSLCTSDKWKNGMHITLCWVMHGRHSDEGHLPIAVGEMLVCCGMRRVMSPDAYCKLECQPEPARFTSFGPVEMWLPCRVSHVSRVFSRLFRVLIRLLYLCCCWWSPLFYFLKWSYMVS